MTRRTPAPAQGHVQDLYELLEVSTTASPEVIQAAYHVLARTWHPDVNKNPEAARRIRQLNGAYAVLSNGERRAIYDLQRVRMRRRERLLARPDRPLPGVAAGQNRPEASARRLAQSAAQAPIRERRSLLSGPALLVLAVVASLVAAALLLVWVGLALSEEPQIGTPGIVVEMQPGPPSPVVPGN